MLSYFRPGHGPLAPDRAAAHRGGRGAFLRQVEAVLTRAAGQGRTGLEEVAPRLVGWIADQRNLWLALDHLAREGGPAPGPDGVSLAELDQRGRWSLIQTLSAQIRSGRYRPGPVREVRIPKASGKGCRTISLACLPDRVVSRAIAQVLEPLLDPRFDPHSFCRRNRSREGALATADAYLRRGRTVWIADDLRAAFDTVPLERLVQLLAKRIASPPVVELLAAAIDVSRGKGLRQGAALSPLLLNAYLDHFLDRPWRQRHPAVPLLRYVDDLLLLCRPEEDAPGLHAELRRLVAAAGMALKAPPDSAVRDLGRGESVRWLGFTLTADAEGIRPRVAADRGPAGLAERLGEHLALAHGQAESPLRAVQILEGLVDSLGPAYLHSDRHEVVRTMRGVAREMAFEELPSAAELDGRWARAYARWAELRQRVAGQLEDESRDNIDIAFARKESAHA